MKRLKLLWLLPILAICLIPFHGLFAQSGHSIVLTWSPPTTGGAVVTYNVKRSTATGTEITIGSVAAPIVTYSDTTGTGGTTYFYVITAVNSGGEGPASNEVSATFLAQIPGAPGSLAATSK